MKRPEKYFFPPLFGNVIFQVSKIKFKNIFNYGIFFLLDAEIEANVSEIESFLLVKSYNTDA